LPLLHNSLKAVRQKSVFPLPGPPSTKIALPFGTPGFNNSSKPGT